MNASPFIPLNALHAVLLAARHGALAPVAEALGVTPGAVSQHIKRAEARTGVLLFARTRQGLKPTPALLAVLPELEAGFAALGRAEAGLVREGGSSVLTVTVGNVFASRWLIWKLGGFTVTHPDIEMRLLTTGALIDLDRPDIDCAIRFGTGDWPGVVATPLGSHRVFPVCAPAIAGALRSPSDLASVPVIADPTAMLSWDAWLEAAGAAGVSLQGPRFSDPALAFDAALAGHGVLLAVAEMAGHALANGQLVRPFAVELVSPFGYWLAMSARRQPPARVRKFRDWLIAAMAEEGKER